MKQNKDFLLLKQYVEGIIELETTIVDSIFNFFNRFIIFINIFVIARMKQENVNKKNTFMTDYKQFKKQITNLKKKKNVENNNSFNFFALLLVISCCFFFLVYSFDTRFVTKAIKALTNNKDPLSTVYSIGKSTATKLYGYKKYLLNPATIISSIKSFNPNFPLFGKIFFFFSTIQLQKAFFRLFSSYLSEYLEYVTDGSIKRKEIQKKLNLYGQKAITYLNIISALKMGRNVPHDGTIKTVLNSLFFLNYNIMLGSYILALFFNDLPEKINIRYYIRMLLGKYDESSLKRHINQRIEQVKKKIKEENEEQTPNNSQQKQKKQKQEKQKQKQQKQQKQKQQKQKQQKEKQQKEKQQEQKQKQQKEQQQKQQ